MRKRRTETGAPRERRDILIGFCATLVVNLGLAFIPQWSFLIWLFQWVYILPVLGVLLFLKRRYIVAGMLLAGGVTLILDVAYCGYSISHPTPAPPSATAPTNHA